MIKLLGEGKARCSISFPPTSCVPSRKYARVPSTAGGNNGAILHAGENHNFCGISRKAEGWCCRERMALLSQHHSVSAGLCLWDCVGRLCVQHEAKHLGSRDQRQNSSLQ